MPIMVLHNNNYLKLVLKKLIIGNFNVIFVLKMLKNYKNLWNYLVNIVIMLNVFDNGFKNLINVQVVEDKCRFYDVNVLYLTFVLISVFF
jgi:hypothetical protein